METQLPPRGGPAGIVFINPFMNKFMNGETMSESPQSPNPQSQTLDITPVFNLYQSLSSMFVGKEMEALASIAGLISNEPVLLIGEPGTAKTAIVETLSRMIDARYFYYLLTQFTEPDELLGPLDINALREGKYVRITRGKLPEAEIVFLDEVFRGSSAIRNILLDIMLNKRIVNGAGVYKLPIVALYTASNFLSTDEEDEAFIDRLTIRVYTRYVDIARLDELVEKGAELTFNRERRVEKVATVEYIRRVQEAVDARALWISRSQQLRSKIVELVATARSEGLDLSDRRVIKLVRVFSAVSIVYAEAVPSPDSLADAFRFTAVLEEADAEKVEKIIARLGLMSPLTLKVRSLKQEVANTIEMARNLLSSENVNFQDVRSVIGSLKRQREVALSLLSEAKQASSRYTIIYSEVSKLVKDIDLVLKSVTELLQ